MFCIYLAVGLFAVKDYGISIDEPMERTTSLANYVFVMGDRMLASESDAVREAALNAPYLPTYQDRFHGAALQSIPVLIEHLNNFEMSPRTIYMTRHIFVFLNYFAAGIFFCLILRRRFGNTWIPVIGALLYILYPRFFGESFYNIKDILFYAWVVIAGYFALKWLESNKILPLLLAAASLAVATNTRVLGLSILLLACFFSIIIDIKNKERPARIILKPVLLAAIAFICYIAITPALWEHPLRNSVALFRHFIQYQPWNETHLYLGEMITRNVPWHYIPVWMGVSIPLLYIALFAIGVISLCFIIRAFMRDRRSAPHMYEMFFTALFFCTLLGYIILKISMYDGWRHAYGIYFPFLYIAVFGLYRASEYLRSRNLPPLKASVPQTMNAAWCAFSCVVTVCIASQLIWLIANHPYQYVYFNLPGKQIAEKNFPLDYWEVSRADMIRYALSHDDRPQITVDAGAYRAKDMAMLTAEEKTRLLLTDAVIADYYIQNTRGPLEERTAPPGFEETAAISVDGMKISILYKRTGFLAVFDPAAWDLVASFESNVDLDPSVLHDGDCDTLWSAGRPQTPGDYITLEFVEFVDYDFISLVTNQYLFDYPRDLAILISADGVDWAEISYTGQYRFSQKPEPYRFLRLENRGSDPFYYWSIYELALGHSN